MNKIVLITGGNKGLGKAFIDLVLRDEHAVVFSISRELHQDHKTAGFERLILIPTDLSEPFSEDSLQVLDTFVTADSAVFLFSNAGTIVPIRPVGRIEPTEILHSVAVNISFPVNLVNTLLGKFPEHNLTLVNISSGAGQNPVSWWSLYGSAKAYMSMFFSVLKEEGRPLLNVYTINPGVLDTDMQKTIRAEAFPRQQDFIAFKANQKLVKPEVAAADILKKVNF